ncbi:oligopeptide ABC transporter substrate-binding protein [Aquisalibacillus elongatus]|uniref:Peptide/nickel transport system substrate-binding protein n=1 Tax=Aquisalibacillus elongatus TaxID=485577 RepID=A0A3N5CB77_9BACI|nr:oligopeptide ABC transporter substrate-binding protein [Aquisalibacillus elongatus]RPF54071.1 peptide/nickel transport system substrate-binding protein [Aquisalibacillus elongatus]
MSKSLFGKFLFVLMLAFVLLIAACNSDEGGEDSSDNDGDDTEQNESDDDDSDSDSDSDQELYSIDDFESYTGEGDAIDGGSLTFGLVSQSPFEGTLNWQFYSGNPDSQVLSWFDESLLQYDENYNVTNEGAASYEVNEEDSSITFTIEDDVKWHDGEEVTAEDWAYSYEVIMHPDYDGVRGSSAGFAYLEGAQEYKAGEADSISGIEIEGEKTITFNYTELTPSLLTGGVWGYPMAKHVFEDIPVEDMASSPEVREEPIGFGPYKVENVVPGESVTYSKFEDYWRGEPNLDEVTLKVVSPSNVANALETGDVDLVDSFPADQVVDNIDMPNVQWLGMTDLAYTYIGFKLGDWNADEGEVNYKGDEMKMGDKKLRKAMWYAVDNETVGERFYNGLRWNGTTLIPPSHPAWHDDSIETPTYDEDKANELLDDAGYKDTNDDGYRETPDGEELVINFASMDSSDLSEPLANYYIQAWDKVGLNVQKLDGRLHEFNSFYDKVGQTGEDDPNVDVFMGAWSVGYDVDPSGLYGRDALFNFTRWANEENDELLAEGLSEEAFDTEYRQDVYSQWQELMVEEVPVFPTLYRAMMVPANERVVNYDISVGSGVYLYELGVTQEEPVVE